MVRLSALGGVRLAARGFRLAALSASPSAVGCKLPAVRLPAGDRPVAPTACLQPAASSPLFLVFYLLASDF